MGVVNFSAGPLYSQGRISVPIQGWVGPKAGLDFFFWRNSPPVGQGLLIQEVSRSHTTTHHSRYDSSGLVISPTQRHLPDNTQHSQQTSMPPMGFEPKISAGERPQTYALDRAATGTGFFFKKTPCPSEQKYFFTCLMISFCSPKHKN